MTIEPHTCRGSQKLRICNYLEYRALSRRLFALQQLQVHCLCERYHKRESEVYKHWHIIYSLHLRIVALVEILSLTNTISI